MKCSRCLNEDSLYFYEDRGVYYCRKCIHFGRIDVGQLPIKKRYRNVFWNGDIQLEYKLTSYQKDVVKTMLSYLQQGNDVLVYAAAGAGKTEIAMEAIALYLSQGKKVGMAIARRQVVLEIKERLQLAFPTLKVIAVCEGYTNVCDGDIIVCTMHQLYRYYQTFSLLIMDEVDAFPYRNNEVLKSIAMHACVQEKVYLTATPDETMLQDVQDGNLKKVELFMRPHGYPLIEPRIVCGPMFWQWIKLWRFLMAHKRENKQILVFVPTIVMCHQWQSWLRVFFRCAVCTSQTINKDQLIEDFRQKKYLFLLCTTVLERGITIPYVDVAILQSDHLVFHEASLIQIIGRVGRSMKAPNGEAILFCRKRNAEIKKCIQAIAKMNAAYK